YLAPTHQRPRTNQVSGLQEAGAQSHFDFQLAFETETALHLRREKGRLHRSEARGQGRVRATVTVRFVGRLSSKDMDEAHTAPRHMRLATTYESSQLGKGRRRLLERN